MANVKKAALMGNQNCGKTTLFNQLTGSNQHVGNFPGVTVEGKEGVVRGHDDLIVVDLPGIYSLSPYTAEEIVARDFVLEQQPAAIINIVDATNLERNLYLTLQLMELGRPMVIALNMMDEVQASGTSIDIPGLEKELGVHILPISASKNEGIEDLINAVLDAVNNGTPRQRLDFCTGAVHKAVHSVAHLIEDHARDIGYPPRFAAVKLIEGDAALEKKINLPEDDRHVLEHIVDEMEHDLGTDREAATADMRYQYIEGICAKYLKKGGHSRERVRTEKIDSVLTHKIWALPVFAAIMILIFYLTFGPIGGTLSDLMESGINKLTAVTDAALTRAGTSDWMHSLIIDGVFNGVGSVLSFLPVIVVLFFFLSMLEDSGYMARVAFVMDSLLRKIGLSGRSFVPMLIGFGCSVPAIMSCRTLASERDRKMTMLLTPFMSCSAKVPIYAAFSAAFFPGHSMLVMIALYFGGMAVAVVCGLLLKRFAFKGNSVPFVMELPVYRFPSLKSVLMLMWDKARDFLERAFTIIFLASVIIWFLQSFDGRFNFIDDSSQSMLAAIGSFVAVIFRPLGFADWRAATALITGFTAKETVISTLSVLLRAGDNVEGMLPQLFTPLAASSFLAFVLLYMPCVATFAAVRREWGSTRGALMAGGFQTLVAYIVALIVYQGGMLLGLG